MAEETGTVAPRAAFPAIALVAASVMLFQISLTRVFSFISWHHLGFMVISVALLGFALSGVLLQLLPARAQPPDRAASRAALLAALSMVGVMLVLAKLPFDPTRLSNPRQLLQLTLVYAVLVVPFTASGLVIVILLRGYGRSVGSLYGSDLVGAGVGSLAAIWGLSWWGGDGLVFLAAAISALAAALLSWPRARVRWGALGLAALFVAAGPAAAKLLDLRPAPNKAMVTMLDPAYFPEARTTYTGWNAISRVDVIERTSLVGWSLNPDSPHPPVAQSLIVIDGDAATPVLHRSGRPDELAFLDYTLSSAAPQAFRPERVLVIGSGGGIDVLTALRNGAERLDAVEVNPLIAELVSRGRYAAVSGDLFADPRVSLHVEDGRSFVRRSAASYDLIQLSLIDTWAASMSGAYSLSESYLYTVGAFEDYLEHLSPEGVLSMTRWLGSPPREALRVCAVANAALERLGAADPSACVVVLQHRNMANTLVKRSPFSREQLEQLRGLASARGFGFAHLPGVVADNDLSRFFASSDRGAFLEGYAHQVTPVLDDSPFFFQFARWSDLLDLGATWDTGHSSGRLLLLLVLSQAGALSLVLLVLPLWRRRRGPQLQPTPWGALGYFGGIGLGFMLLEVSLMQRYTLFLGSPTYAFALVLAALLIGAGLGSALTRRLERWAPAVFAALVLGVLAHAWAVPPLLRAALDLGVGARALLSAATIFPLGVLLGMPFPLAMSRLALDREDSIVGWAWAANGCTSVVGPILAVLLAIDLGFTWVQVGAALIYGLVYLVLPPPA